MFLRRTRLKVVTDEARVKRLLSRGVEEVIERDELVKKLISGKELRVKLGIDPTSPNIHLGRSIPLLKLRDFQELGHKIVLIIGNFTGIVGDTSDKDSERPMLSERMVKENMKNYVDQAKKIIDIKKCEVRYNADWLRKLGFAEIGRQADVFSLNGFISRENIKKRLDAGKRVSLRELLYPLMQGYDSVQVHSDVEIGGTDQRFNLLAGRELQRLYGQTPQNIMSNPLIEGLDGRKMSSSWGNTINLLDSASDMFGKVMSLKDELIIRYFVLATRVDMAEIQKYESELKSGINPKDIKEKLASEIVSIYHGRSAASAAASDFGKTFREGGAPEEMKETEIVSGAFLSEVLLSGGLISSKTEFRRLVGEGAVTLHETGEKIMDSNFQVRVPAVFKIGKRRFIKITIRS